MIIVFVIGARPGLLEVLNQSRNLGVKAANVGRDGASQPVGVASVGNLESADLGKEPREDKSDSRGKDQARWSSESGFAKSLQRSWDVARLCLAKRFDGADVTSQESKHGHPNAALPW